MTEHNHMTRDIKPQGLCPKCDEQHYERVETPEPVRFSTEVTWCITHNRLSEGLSQQRINCRWVHLSYTSDDPVWYPKKRKR